VQDPHRAWAQPKWLDLKKIKLSVKFENYLKNTKNKKKHEIA